MFNQQINQLSEDILREANGGEAISSFNPSIINGSIHFSDGSTVGGKTFDSISGFTPSGFFSGNSSGFFSGNSSAKNGSKSNNSFGFGWS